MEKNGVYGVWGTCLVLVSLGVILVTNQSQDSDNSVFAQDPVVMRALLITGSGQADFVKAVSNDAQHLKEVLLTGKNWNNNNIKILSSPDRQTLEKEIKSFFQNNNDNDISIIYFSGHGTKNGNGEEPASQKQERDDRDELLVLQDANEENKRLVDDDLNDLLKDISGVKILVVDACKCDGIFGGNDDYSLTKSIIMTGCAEKDLGQQIAPIQKRQKMFVDNSNCTIFEFAKSKQFANSHLHSTFTIQLIAGLGNFNVAADDNSVGVLADSNLDGKVSVKEWFEFAEDNLTSAGLRGAQHRPRIHAIDADPSQIIVFDYTFPNPAKRGFSFESFTSLGGSRITKCGCEPLNEFTILSISEEEFPIPVETLQEDIGLFFVEPLDLTCLVGPTDITFTNSVNSTSSSAVEFVPLKSDLPFPGFEFPDVVLPPGSNHTVNTDEWDVGNYVFKASSNNSFEEVIISKSTITVGGRAVTIVMEEQQ